MQEGICHRKEALLEETGTRLDIRLAELFYLRHKTYSLPAASDLDKHIFACSEFIREWYAHAHEYELLFRISKDANIVTPHWIPVARTALQQCRQQMDMA